MQIWEKFNPRERQAAIGAGLVIVAWIVSLTTFGIGSYTLALLGAIAVLVIYYLKYTNTSINWPAPVSLIVLGISGIVALLAIVALLGWISILSLGFIFGMNIVAVVIQAIGAGLMAWGAWQEYQIEKPAMPTMSSNRTAEPPPPPPPASTYVPPSQPSTPPTTPDDTEGAPPA
jgi:hypothetical protein